MQKKPISGSDYFEFAPYADLKWLLILSLCEEIIFLLFFFSHWIDFTGRALILLLFVLNIAMCAWMTKLISLRVRIDKISILVSSRISKNAVRYLWQEFKYGYYLYDFKGRKHLLLSQERLNQNDLRSVFRKELNTLTGARSKLVKGQYLCLRVNAYQSCIEHFADGKVIIDNYKY